MSDPTGMNVLCSTKELKGEFDMKKLAFALFIPFALAACGSPQLPTQELRDMKPTCAGGDANVCSNIGHKVRNDILGTAPVV